MHCFQQSRKTIRTKNDYLRAIEAFSLDNRSTTVDSAECVESEQSKELPNIVHQQVFNCCCFLFFCFFLKETKQSLSLSITVQKKYQNLPGSLLRFVCGHLLCELCVAAQLGQPIDRLIVVFDIFSVQFEKWNQFDKNVANARSTRPRLHPRALFALSRRRRIEKRY